MQTINSDVFVVANKKKLKRNLMPFCG